MVKAMMSPKTYFTTLPTSVAAKKQVGPHLQLKSEQSNGIDMLIKEHGVARE
jgi:hypothetical protein